MATYSSPTTGFSKETSWLSAVTERRPLSMYAGKATNQYAYGNSMASKSFSVEKVAVFFPALSSPDEKTRSQGGKALREFIEEQSRERSPRSFDELIEKVRKKFAEMANSENIDELRGCLLGIDQVTDVCQSHADRRILLFFHTYVNNILNGDNTDIETANVAASTLGHIIRSAGTLIASRLLEDDVKRAYDNTKRGGSENTATKRIVATLVLEQVAINAPTIFFHHISDFFENIYDVLCDDRENVRSAAEKALAAAYILLENRNQTLKRQIEIERIYTSAYEKAMGDLQSKKASNYKIHAAFTIMHALLKHAGMFMVTNMNTGKKNVKYIFHNNFN